MKFRGFDARTQATRWGLFAVAVGIVIGATAPTAIAGLAGAWEANRSSLPWVFERTFAFLAYGAVAGSVIYGLLLSTKVLDAVAHRPITFALHQDLASFGVGLAAIHGMLLALDKSVPFSLAEIAVPGLAPYAPMWVAAGQVAFYLMAAVLASFYLRRRHRATRLAPLPLSDVPGLHRGDRPRAGSGDRQRVAVGLVALRRVVGGRPVPVRLPDHQRRRRWVIASFPHSRADPVRCRPDGPPERAVRPGRTGRALP